MIESTVDFSKYMNMYECPVKMGSSYKRTDLFIDNTLYTVKDIVLKNDKWYALCVYKDNFSGELVEDLIFAHYLEEI